MAAADSKLRQLLQPVVEALGCELWGLELQSGGKTQTTANLYRSRRRYRR